MDNDKLSKIISLCKRRGFVFLSCGLYGGLGAVWDYGPLGVMLKKNIKDTWWKTYVEQRTDIVGLDASILMSEQVFLASGHLKGFTDDLIDCKFCKKRFKLEQLVGEKAGPLPESLPCPECGSAISLKDTPVRKFNLMLKTYLGVVDDDKKPAYLRPETAQGIFTNFSNVLNSLHKKVPFGIAQIGKAFRNEITTKSFIFRTREFEQMEIEFFTHPKDAGKWYEYWIEERKNWYIDKLGISKDDLRLRSHRKDELAHYAKACSDIEFNFPFGWKELEGIANRRDFDLKSHSDLSKKDLSFFSPSDNEKFIPYVIEPSAGVDRTVLAVLSGAYFEEEVNGKTRVVLKIDKRIAPYKIAVFPLLKNRSELVEKARKIHSELNKEFISVYDDTAAIGKLYRRQDEVGTPFCVTVDVESLSDNKVTVRSRDSMAQDRIETDKLNSYFRNKFSN